MKPNYSIEHQGISGIARLRNEEDFLPIVLERFLPFLDEIILVYDAGSIDKTKEICEDFQRKNPHKVKVYNYPYRVYPANSRELLVCEENDPCALWNYYNWSFSKSTCSHSMKIDGDLVPRKDLLNYKELIWEELNNSKPFIEVHGANLFIQDNELKVFTTEHDFTVCTGLEDHFIRKNDVANLFYRKKDEPWEKWFYPKFIGLCIPSTFFYYHMRGCKQNKFINWGYAPIMAEYNTYKEFSKIGRPEYNKDWVNWEKSYRQFIKKHHRLDNYIELGLPNPNEDKEFIEYLKKWGFLK
jgi:glycosyltransferase involved in cell wall biosynthesis